MGVLARNKISILLITDFWLDTLKSHTNIIWRSIKNTQFSKITRLWLKIWVCYAHLNLKIQLGVAGTIFELQPWKFRKISIFYGCSNHITTNFVFQPASNLEKMPLSALSIPWGILGLQWVPDFPFIINFLKENMSW